MAALVAADGYQRAPSAAERRRRRAVPLDLLTVTTTHALTTADP
jgi:hypothetical protein